MATRMQQRRGTAQQWTDANPILAAGEIGFETDTNEFRIGDGVNHWADLSPFKNLADLGGSLDDYVLISTKGQAGGVASLGVDGKIPSGQLPDELSFDAEVTTAVSNAMATEVTNRNSAIATAKSQAITAAETYADGLASNYDAAGSATTAKNDAKSYADGLISTEVTNRNSAIATAKSQAISTAEGYTDTKIGDLVNSAPAALDTLKEIADVLGDSTNLTGTLISNIGGLNTDLSTHKQNHLNVHGIADTTMLATGDDVQTAINTHSGHSTDVHGIANTADLATKTFANNAVTSGVSTHNTATTNVHGIADTSALATKTYVGTAVSDHAAVTTSVHGITDTANLVYTSDSRLSDQRTPSAGSVTAAKIATDAVETAKIKDLNVTTAKIADSAITSAKIADGTIVTADIADSAITSAKIADATIVDGDISATAAIAQSKVANLTSDLAAKLASATAATTYAPIASPTFTGTVAGITKSMVGLANVDNTSDANKPISTATQTALDAKLASATAASTYAPIASPTFTGTVSGVTKSMVGLGNVDNTSDANKPVSTATQTALDAKLALAGGTMTGALTLSGAPTSDLHAATKLYVDGIASGINFHAPVKAATSTNISTTYSNGTNGYGATLTADANGAMGTVDGQTMSVGDRVLVKAQTDAKQNGIYVITSLGGASSKWVMTRAADADNNPNGEVAGGDFCFVTAGTLAANTGYILSGTSTVVIGTDNINYVQFNAAQAINAGTGLSKSGATLSIDTATTVDLNTAQTLTNKTLTSPTLTTPALGVATATSINGTTIPSSKTLVTTADSGTVTSTMIADGTIVDADINASAAIAQSKISGLSASFAAKAPLSAPSFTGGVTVDSSGIIFTDGTQTKEGVPSRTTIQQKTASYTLSALTERDNMIEVSSSSATTITIPTNATLALPVGTSIDILQTNTGQVTIAGAAGVTVNGTPGLKLRTQWSSATLFKRATDTWVVMGDLSA